MMSLVFILLFCPGTSHSQRLFANARTDDELFRILQAYDAFVYVPENYEPFLYEEPDYDALLFGYNAFPDYELFDYEQDWLDMFDFDAFHYGANEYEGNKGGIPNSAASFNSTDSNSTDYYDYSDFNYGDFYDILDSKVNDTDVSSNETESAVPEAPAVPVQAPPTPDRYVIEYVYLGDPIVEFMPLFPFMNDAEDADLDAIVLV